jgi:hypothetical protein
MEETSGSMWVIATIGGPVVLGIFLADAAFRTRKRRRAGMRGDQTALRRPF